MLENFSFFAVGFILALITLYFYGSYLQNRKSTDLRTKLRNDMYVRNATARKNKIRIR